MTLTAFCRSRGILLVWMAGLVGLVLVFGLTGSPSAAWALQPTPALNSPNAVRASAPITTVTYLPVIAKEWTEACAPIAGETYSTLTIQSAPTNPPAESNPDLNLALRGYVPTNAFLGLVDYIGP